MKKSILCITMLILRSIVFSQTFELIKTDSKNYLWGEGKATTISRADQEALQMLVSQISAQIESKFTLLKDEVMKTGKSDFSEECRMMVSTYSNTTLTNVERIVLGNEPDVKVLRYIRRTEVGKIFEQRKQKSMILLHLPIITHRICRWPML